MPSLMVCALLGLAVAVLYDVARAPVPAVTLVETPVVIVGLERLRRMAGIHGQVSGDESLVPRLTRGAHGTPTYFLTLTDVTGEVELPQRPLPMSKMAELVALPSVIVEDC